MNKSILHIKICLLVLMVSFPVLGKGGKRLLKNQEIFESLVQTNPIQLEELVIEEYKTDLMKSIELLQKKKSRLSSDKDFLSHLFYYVHRVYLKKYKPYQSFEKLFANGEYGCLTGTALYALILEEFGYRVEIRETNYHVFLLVKTDEARYLIESTDPLHGFLSDNRLISERLSAISVKTGVTNSGKYQFNCKINRAIQLDELIGLQYYNVATQYYNQGYFDLALCFLQKSRQTYHSKRQKEFFELISSQKAIASENNIASSFK